MSAADLQLVADIKTLDGTKKFCFVPLRRREAAKVFHNSVKLIVEALANIGTSINNETVNPEGLSRALKVLDFDLLWDLAEKICKLMIVDGNDVADIEDYFGENPEELYLVLFHGIRLNYPKQCGQIMKRLGDSGLAGLVEKLKNQI